MSTWVSTGPASAQPPAVSRATPETVRPSICVSVPAAYSSPACTPSTSIVPVAEVASAVHAAPFHDAMRAWTPPIEPPAVAARSWPSRASRSCTVAVAPPPNCAQASPPHIASRCAGRPPMDVNSPPATSWPLKEAIVKTREPTGTEPMVCQVDPFQRRIGSGTPSGSSTHTCSRSPCTTTSRTTPGPPPIGIHCAPFQRAIPLNKGPPATEIAPPTIRSPLCTVRAWTVPKSRGSGADHVAPSQKASGPVRRVPACWKSPPTARTAGSGPAPSGSQGETAWTVPSTPGKPSAGSQPPHWPRAA